MTKPVFNPDDFVFQKLELPEDNPTLIEYDAKAKLIYVRIQDPATKEYEYNAVHLTETVNSNLLDHLPDEWSNENDRILLFAVHQDGSVFLQKEKLKYNFETQQTFWVRYEYKNFSQSDAKEIFDALKAAVFVQNAKNEQDRNSSLVALAQKDVFLDRMYIQILQDSERMLRETDWRILEDAPQSFEGERSLWIQWREAVRNSPRRPEDFESDLDFLIYKEEFKWPINPEQYHQLYPSHDVGYLSTPDQFVLGDTSVTEDRVTMLNEQLSLAIKTYKYNQENGIPISKEMYDVIQRYSLLDNIDSVNLTVGEE